MPKIFSKRLERTCHDMCKVYPSCIVPMQRNSKSSLRKLLSCMFAHKCLQCFKCLMCFQPQLIECLPFYFQAWKSCNYDWPTWWLPFNIFLSMEVLWLWLTYLVVTFHSHFKHGTKLQSFLFHDFGSKFLTFIPKARPLPRILLPASPDHVC